MIHVYIGTKAQLVKMAPIMKELDSRGVQYNFIDGGQHAGLTDEFRDQFGLRVPDVRLRRERNNINSIGQALSWTLSQVAAFGLNRDRAFSSIFQNQSGVCLIHGDTWTTLMSLLFAKRCGLAVAHVEAGLRSYNLFDPFPEEIVRLIAMRFSDLLFAPSQWAFDNLCAMGYRRKAVNVGANTGLDAVRYALSRNTAWDLPTTPYAVMTIHRMETIYSRVRLRWILDLTKRIARDRALIFVLHDPTKQQLDKHGLLPALLTARSVQTRSLLPYLEFVNLLAGADFVATDGGSIQEECFFLDKPCMVLRSKTERPEGLGENARLVDFDQDRVETFLLDLSCLRRKTELDSVNPSGIIVEYIRKWCA